MFIIFRRVLSKLLTTEMKRFIRLHASLCTVQLTFSFSGIWWQRIIFFKLVLVCRHNTGPVLRYYMPTWREGCWMGFWHNTPFCVSYTICACLRARTEIRHPPMSTVRLLDPPRRPRVNTPLSDIHPPVQLEPGVLHKVVQRQPRAQEDRLPWRLFLPSQDSEAHSDAPPQDHRDT